MQIYFTISPKRLRSVIGNSKSLRRAMPRLHRYVSPFPITQHYLDPSTSTSILVSEEASRWSVGAVGPSSSPTCTEQCLNTWSLGSEVLFGESWISWRATTFGKAALNFGEDMTRLGPHFRVEFQRQEDIIPSSDNAPCISTYHWISPFDSLVSLGCLLGLGIFQNQQQTCWLLPGCAIRPC